MPDAIDDDVDDGTACTRISVLIVDLKLLETVMLGRVRKIISLAINAEHVVLAEGNDLNTLNAMQIPLLEDTQDALGRTQYIGVIVPEPADITIGAGRFAPLAGYALNEPDDDTDLGRRTDLGMEFILDAEFPIVVSTNTTLSIARETELTVTGILTTGVVETTDAAVIVGKGLN